MTIHDQARPPGSSTARRRAELLLRLPWSFRRQIVVLTAAVTAIAMLLLSLVLQVVLARVTNNDVDRVLADRATAVIASVQTDSAGSITVSDAVLDAGVAVFNDSAELVAGSTPRRLHEFFEDLAVTKSVQVEEVRGSRVRAEPFTTADGTSGTVVVTERLEPYEEAESLALIVSLVTGALATAAAAGVAAWAVRRALRPVAEMAATASDWSEHDLARRFTLGPPSNEITALAGTLDTLLDKVSSAIRSEQRLTSEFAHELRTPLTSIQGTADLMLLRVGPQLDTTARADLAEISAASQRMAATITTLLDLARSEASVVAASSCGLRDAVGEVLAGLPDPGDAAPVQVDVDVADCRLALPHALAVRAVSPVVDNALHFATSTVTVSSLVVEGAVEIEVRDDGPGVDGALVDDIFEPGRTSGTGAGAGLGLAISRRIARTAGGDVRLARTDAGGGCFVIVLPLA